MNYFIIRSVQVFVDRAVLNWHQGSIWLLSGLVKKLFKSRCLQRFPILELRTNFRLDGIFCDVSDSRTRFARSRLCECTL
jgi:hypothetical protein